MSQRILGIDLGARAVKAVLVESTYRGYTVLEHGAAVLGSEAEGATLLSRQAAALEALVSSRGWRFQESVAALPGAGMASSVVTLPFTDPRRIVQTISYEVEAQLPFELSDVAWDWQVLGVRDGKSDLFVGVARKEELATLLAALAPLGVDPRAVLPPAPVYSALLAGGAVGPLASPAVPAVPAAPAPADEPAGAEAILDVGQDRTSLCLAVAGGCEHARTFAFGATQLARAVARELGCPEERAHALLAAAARGGAFDAELAPLATDPRAAEALHRAFGPLAREVRSTLRAWRTRVGPRRVARLHLAGELGRLPGMPELLAPEVDGPVQPLVLEGPSATIPAEDAPGYALALALALHGHQGARAPRLNLRRGEHAYTRDFEHLRGRIAKLAWAAAAVVLLAVASAGVKVAALSRQEALLERSRCEAEQKLLGKCYPSYEEAESVLKGRGAGGGALPKVSAVDLLVEVANRIPADVSVKFDKIDVAREKLHLEGSTDSAENVDRMVNALKSSTCFQDAKPGASRRRADGKFEFSIDSGLTCLEAGNQPAGGGRG
ncbi:MAG TPA: pilus assembly protein PilM [Anaeromyxobacter sp.]|nr:pilus assembly protein PilM [Anaeromyxobacter sp.]